MRFIADNMVGKLVKWLRFMGYDVLYPKTMNDSELLKLANSDGRLLLTRDKELTKFKDFNGLYIKSEKLDDQLSQVIAEFDLMANRLNLEFTRCPECNNLLETIDRSELEDKVPKGVQERQDRFWFCSGCDRYYWRGTHYDKIKKKLEDLKSFL